MKNKGVRWLGIFLVISLVGNIFFFLKNKLPVLNKSQKTVIQTVTRIIDGDTFDTKEGLRVRLAKADAPEYPKGCFSLQAKERLTKLILAKEVMIEVAEKDSFERSVANVYENDLYINKIMISEGYARAFGSAGINAVSAELLDVQEEARKAERGIWSSVCVNPNGDCVINFIFRFFNWNSKTKDEIL